MGARKESRDLQHFREAQPEDIHLHCRTIEAGLLAENANLRKQVINHNQALMLIERLRAENRVLKDEKRRFVETVENCKRHISIVGNPTKKYAVALVKNQLQKARLI